MSNKKLYRGSLSTIILKLLGDNGRMYGYEITQKVKELTQGELTITEGALYPSLHKLEAEGHLQVEYEQVNNRMRKYYSLTENGTKEVVHKVSEMEAFLQTMQGLLQPKLNYNIRN